MTEHKGTRSHSKHADPMTFLVMLAVLATLLGGMWMLGKSLGAETDSMRSSLDALSRQISFEHEKVQNQLNELQQQCNLSEEPPESSENPPQDTTQKARKH